MDFGKHTYYFACPRPDCGEVYEVLEIAVPDTGDNRRCGLLACPYCGWVVHLCTPVLAIRLILKDDQQAVVRGQASCRTGRLDVSMRLCFEHQG